jgi:hypothetical protein
VYLLLVFKKRPPFKILLLAILWPFLIFEKESADRVNGYFLQFAIRVKEGVDHWIIKRLPVRETPKNVDFRVTDDRMDATFVTEAPLRAFYSSSGITKSLCQATSRLSASSCISLSLSLEVRLRDYFKLNCHIRQDCLERFQILGSRRP